jgi:hypothetical protein
MPLNPMAAGCCRLAWLALPPLMSSLYWHFILKVVFFSNSLRHVVLFVKNSLMATVGRTSKIDIGVE